MKHRQFLVAMTQKAREAGHSRYSPFPREGKYFWMGSSLFSFEQCGTGRWMMQGKREDAGLSEEVGRYRDEIRGWFAITEGA